MRRPLDSGKTLVDNNAGRCSFTKYGGDRSFLTMIFVRVRVFLAPAGVAG